MSTAFVPASGKLSDKSAEYAREIRGADDVRASVGGFHFFGPPDRGVQCMVEEIHVTGPRVVVPVH